MVLEDNFLSEHNAFISLYTIDTELLSIIRPVKNSTFRVFDITGIKLLTRLRLHFGDLNENRFRHAFDCITPVCICGLANEDNEHFDWTRYLHMLALAHTIFSIASF